MLDTETDQRRGEGCWTATKPGRIGGYLQAETVAARRLRRDA